MTTFKYDNYFGTEGVFVCLSILMIKCGMGLFPSKENLFEFTTTGF